MRLGDLDALKEDFKSRLADCNEWIEKAKDKETKIRASAVKAFIGEVIMTIDNAQTVEETKTVADCIMAYGDGYETARRLYERPQGKWIYTPNIIGLSEYEGITCSICGDDSIGDFNFCPNCGADMRGKEE